MLLRIVDSAQVDPSATVGEGSSIWDYVQIREDVTTGEECIIGRGAYIGSGVMKRESANGFILGNKDDTREYLHPARKPL